MSTSSHKANAASAKRKKTNSPAPISASANFIVGVADDHNSTAPSIARVAELCALTTSPKVPPHMYTIFEAKDGLSFAKRR